MCNQAVSLVAAELERRGISTVALILLRRVAERVGPPRALAVPFSHGHALGEPGDAAGQRRVIEAALSLLETAIGRGPVLVDYPSAPRRPGDD